MKIALARLFVLVGIVALVIGFTGTGTAWAEEPPTWDIEGKIKAHGIGVFIPIGIQRFQNRVVWILLAVPPDPTKPGSHNPEVTLTPGDTEHPTTPMTSPAGFPAGVTVSAFDAEVDNQLVGKAGKKELYFSGEFKTFLLSGCPVTDVYYIQLIRITTTTKEGANDPETTTGTWELDGKVPNEGELEGDPPGADSDVLIDYPGRFAPDPNGPIMEKKDDKGPKNPPNRPNNGTVKQVWEIETWIVCRGDIIGFAKWGFTVTQNFAGGAPAGPPDVSDVQTPSLHGTGDSPNAGTVEKLKK